MGCGKCGKWDIYGIARECGGIGGSGRPLSQSWFFQCLEDAGTQPPSDPCMDLETAPETAPASSTSTPAHSTGLIKRSCPGALRPKIGNSPSARTPSMGLVRALQLGEERRCVGHPTPRSVAYVIPGSSPQRPPTDRQTRGKVARLSKIEPRTCLPIADHSNSVPTVVLFLIFLAAKFAPKRRGWFTGQRVAHGERRVRK